MTTYRWNFLALGAALVLGACVHTANDALPKNPDSHTAALASVKTHLDQAKNAPKGGIPVSALTNSAQAQAKAEEPAKPALPMLTAMGFSQVSKQPGASLNQRRIMAIRAAQVEALRNLTEQIHGVKINSSTTIREARVYNDRIDALIQGELRGAKTLSIKPKDSDTFEVTLGIEPATVAYIVQAVKG